MVATEMPELGNDPYGDIKIYHKAHLFARDGSGAVSPLCANTPRKLRGNKHTWTLCDDAVTCPKCKAKLAVEVSN